MNECLAGWSPGFTPQDVAALMSVTEGPVLLAGSSNLANELFCADSTIVHEPDLVVGATSAADVQAAVRFAADFHVPLAVLAPGHQAPCSAKGGVLITTGRMNQIHLDARGHTAIAGAGALWSQVVDRAAELGLAPLVPSYPHVVIVGRMFGWTAGHVRAIDVVTADGQFRHLTPANDPRLFRALCDSEADEVELGVVTAMTFALFR